MAPTPGRLVVAGALVAAVAVALGAAGAALAGPRIPGCLGAPLSEGCATPARLTGLALEALALPVGILGGLLVAIGLARRAAAEDEAEADPGKLEGAAAASAADERAP